MPPTPSVQLLPWQTLTAGDMRFSQHHKICVTTVAMLDDLLGRLDDPARRVAIQTMMDKHAFRQLLSASYPDLTFRTIHLRDLPQQVFDPHTTYIIKPVRGAFASGVRAISATTDLTRLMDEIQHEMRRTSAVLSDRALSQDEFLIETFIEGEEYAVDMFYNSAGQPMITNIYHHPMPRNLAYLHMLYYSSKNVFEQIYEPAREFFSLLNTHLQVTRLPIHAEFRYHQGRLVPIELNPLRFGGMGLANLGFYAFGMNAYQHFAEDREPDWGTVWHDRPDSAYGFVIAYNGATTDVSTHKPNWPMFRQRFLHILREVALDYQTQLAFGILYIEETPDRLLSLLDAEFDDYFVPTHVQ